MVAPGAGEICQQLIAQHYEEDKLTPLLKRALDLALKIKG
jgi:hypothetical protein